MAGAPLGAPYSPGMPGSPITLDTDGSPDSVTVAIGGAAETVDAAPREVGVGAALGRFVVLEEVGRGGMGRVLRAYDPKLQREVALKVLRGDVLDEEGHGRLVREAQAMARLSHPNVVAVHDVEDGPNGVMLVMEYVDGTTLQRWLRTPRPWAEVLARFLDAGRGLAAAHAQGLLHRDFKPANVLVASDGRVKVTDFGLAKPTGPEPSSARAMLASASSSGLLRGASRQGGAAVDGLDTPWPEHAEGAPLSGTITRIGTVMGTPRYMAPEQHLGEALDAAADQYAFCVALWEALAGVDPFAGDEARRDGDLRLLQRKQEGPGPWPAASEVPKAVIEALRRGLAPTSARRWPDMGVLLARLAEVLAPRRRREVLALSLAGVVVTGSLVWLSATRAGAPAPSQCSGGRAQLGSAWDDARREAVRQAIMATEAPYAAGVVRYVETALGGHAEAWVAAHRETCEATTVRGEQSAAVMDLRMACLHRAQVRLQAATSVLATADLAVVEHAHELVRGLDSLDRCADVHALRAAVEPPDSGQAPAVDELRTRLAEVDARTLAARYAAAREVLDAVAPEVEALGYEPLRTELELARGRLLQGAGEYDAAEAALRQALRLGTRWQQWAEVRSAALRLMYVVGYQRVRPDEALHYRELAEGLVEHGDDPAARITLYNNLGVIAFSQGRFADAEAALRRTAELAAELMGPQHLETLRPLANMALAQYRQGQLEPALAELRRVSARYEELFGPDHPETAISLNNVALVLAAQGHHDEAEVMNRRVLDIRERALGPDHPDLAKSHSGLGNVLVEQGKLPEAEVQLRRALALVEAALGPDHPDVAVVRSNVGNAAFARGQYAEAEVDFQRALTVMEAALGPDHPNTAVLRSNHAEALHALGRHREAELEHRQALARLDVALGPEHPEVAKLRTFLAATLAAQGKHDDAEAELRRALAVLEGALGPDHPDVADARARLADTLRARTTPREHEG